jgi:hypothetical protein
MLKIIIIYILKNRVMKVANRWVISLILAFMSLLPVSGQTFIDVTNLTVANWGAIQPAGSLAGAIAQANTAGPGTYVIRLLIAGTLNEGGGNPAPYNVTNNNVTIDGTYAPGWSCGAPKFFMVGPGYNSFNFSGTNGILKAVGITQFSLNVTGANFQLYGCWFGLNNAGTALSGGAPGPSYGASVTGGGASLGQNNNCNRNIFSTSGVTSNLVVTGNGNTISGNYFNSGSNGLARLNTVTGSVLTIQGNNNTIDSNMVLGAAGGGSFSNIAIIGASDAININNNNIGVNINGQLANGAAGYGNDGHGIHSSGAITGASVINKNVISNNKQSGISIEANNTGLTIANNIVGLPGNGTQASTIYGNGDSGIRFFTSGTSTSLSVNNNTVCNSGLVNSAGNAATTSGIIFNSVTVTSATITNNYTGLDRSFNGAGNQFPGIYFFSCGNMGGSNLANVVASGNVVGFNGIGLSGLTSDGIAAASSNYFTITNNYVGIGPGGQNIGNLANGIEINTCTNFLITNNQVQNNQGKRTTAQADACGGIICFASSLGTIQGNNASNNPNAGGGFTNNHGIVVQQQGKILIGGTTAGQPNTINGNGTHGVFVFDGADNVQMTQNIIVCNISMGISLNVPGDPNTDGPKGVGNTSMTTGPTLATTGCPGAGIAGSGNANGTAPGNNATIEVFGTPACKTCPSAQRGEASYYQQTVTATGTTWTATGVTGNVSVTATNSVGSGGYFPTSRFSTCQACSLPIELLYFGAYFSGNTVKVNWSTAQEKNSEMFIIERSTDGKNFTEIGTVRAAGMSNGTLYYNFVDENPILSGLSYYRLREVDLNGESSSTSQIVSVINNGASTISLFPNPAKSVLVIEVNNLIIYTVEIIDLTGRLVYTTSENNVSGVSELSVDVSSFNKGIYYVLVKGNTSNHTSKLIVE